MSVLWISLSAEVPSENLLPPMKQEQNGTGSLKLLIPTHNDEIKEGTSHRLRDPLLKIFFHFVLSQDPTATIKHQHRISKWIKLPHSCDYLPMASISSMKMIHGWWSLAYPNISLIRRALSPMYLSTIALDTTFGQEKWWLTPSQVRVKPNRYISFTIS